MINNDVREILAEFGYENYVLFENPSYDNSIVGITTDGNVVYDYDKMVEELAMDDGMTLEDAADFISYNTLSIMDNVDEASARPIIMHNILN